MQYNRAPDLKRLGTKIIKSLNLAHIDTKRIFYYRGVGSKSKSIARVWGFSRILQLASNFPAFYVIEVISPRFDKLSIDQQQKVLIHEFLHIPKTFSGSLLAHKGRGRNLESQVRELFNKYTHLI